MQFITEATVYIFFSASLRNDLIFQRTSLHTNSSKFSMFSAFFFNHLWQKRV